MTRRGRLTIVGLLVALVIACLVAAGIGQLQVPPDQVLGSILHRLGIDILPMPTAPRGDDALWLVRFPRVLLAILVGAALGCAGALMQGVFGNPLAEPGVIGVSSGAAIGAFACIVFGISALGSWTVPVAAFLGGLLATLIVYGLARSGGRTEVVTLVLVGIAVTAFAGAIIGMLTFVSSDDALRSIAFWNLGSLARATWDAVLAVTPFVMVGVAVAMYYAPQLDLLALGERPARHLGVDIERLRLLLIVVIALLAGAGVAFTGIIAFVGLVVPHLIRLVTGPSHRILIPASVLGGAVVVVVGDLIARTLIENQELPLGVLTALIGAPFFFWLIRRTRTRAGGWA
ncbi:MAG: iron ABC transporter permease [Chloroflexi bacterium]|nr:iron ABC transporter permease [Chloroflexota bacterium]